jgi:hypothetical protein
VKLRLFAADGIAGARKQLCAGVYAMNISSVGNGADLLGAAAEIAQGTTASDASIGVLKTALDASASTAEGLASLVAQVGNPGSLSVYA